MATISVALDGALQLDDKASLKDQCLSLQDGFERLFEEIVLLSETDIITSTHQARKTLKSYRAFIKLLKKCPGLENYKQANYLLRDLGKEFSNMRDCHVRDMLITQLNRPLQSNILKGLRKMNQAEQNIIESILLRRPNQFNVLSRTIKLSSLLTDLLERAHIQKACVTEGMESAFQKSRSAFLICSEQKNEEQFHEWRKRLKDLLNQIKLFKTESDLHSDERFSPVDKLCEEMGMLNDLAMLKEWIGSSEFTQKEKQDYQRIIQFLDKKINSFQDRLLMKGHAFYKESANTLNDLESIISDV